MEENYQVVVSQLEAAQITGSKFLSTESQQSSFSPWGPIIVNLTSPACSAIS